MTTNRPRLVKCIAALVAVGCVSGMGAERYVAVNGAHVSPFNSWAKAATNIQAAVDAAGNGDTVVLSNGLYLLREHVVVTKRITLRGAQGATASVIAGMFPASSNRCVYLGHAEAMLDGVTVSNGAAFNEDEETEDELAYGNGGGVYCLGGSVVNCVIVNCRALLTGARIYARDTLISNCTVRGNYIDAENELHCGAGICCGDTYDYYADHVTNKSAIVDCVIEGNAATNSDGNADVGLGGGVFLAYGSRLVRSVVLGNAAGLGGGVAGEGGSIAGGRIIGNVAGNKGGGVFTYRMMVQDETNLVMDGVVVSNNAAGAEGGGLYSDGVIQCRNSVMAGNQAVGSGGGVGGSGMGVFENCTITKNRAEAVAGMDGSGWQVFNTIIYSNISDDVTREDNDYYSAAYFAHCCVHPDVPEEDLEEGFGENIAQVPQFVDYAAGDFRLAGSSPCINGGTNLPWMAGATDIAGAQRVQNTYVDIGAYEQAPTGTIIRVSRMTLDFGDVVVGEQSGKALTVANPGLGVLQGYAAVEGAGMFNTASETNYSLSTFQSKRLEFTFSPTNEGEFVGTAVLVSSPGAEVRLYGYGVPEGGTMLTALFAVVVAVGCRVRKITRAGQQL